MNSAHDFCRLLLSQARTEAKISRVTLPNRITALRSTRDQFFVEADGRAGVYVSGCCSYEAKAKYIGGILDAQGGKVE